MLHDRLQYLRAVLDAPGPLQPYRDFGLSFLERFEASASLRNTMAHARMQFTPMGIRFTEVGHLNGALRERYNHVQPQAMIGLARRATRLSRLCQRVVVHIDARGLLPRQSSVAPEAAEV